MAPCAGHWARRSEPQVTPLTLDAATGTPSTSTSVSPQAKPVPRTTTYGSEARSPSNEVTAGTICSSADPWPGTRTHPRGDVQAGIVAESEPRPVATVAGTGRVPRSQPPDAPGRSVSSSTWTFPVKP